MMWQTLQFGSSWTSEIMDEKEIMAASQELEAIRAQLDTMAKQDELIQVTLEEYIRAKEAIDDLKTKKKGDEILVPIGANCWVHAVLGDPKKAIASIGSNLAVGQNTDDVISRLDRQLEEIEEAKKEVTSKMSELDSKAASLTQMLQAVYAEMQGQPPQ